MTEITIKPTIDIILVVLVVLIVIGGIGIFFF